MSFFVASAMGSPYASAAALLPWQYAQLRGYFAKLNTPRFLLFRPPFPALAPNA